VAGKMVSLLTLPLLFPHMIGGFIGVGTPERLIDELVEPHSVSRIRQLPGASRISSRLWRGPAR
jgi:hypothetical protein